MISCIRQCLTCPVAVFTAIILASAGALAAAYASQYIGGLQPCILCLYQRAPFAIALLWGLAGLMLRKNEALAKTFLVLCALAFLANAGIASYHSGVELGWWESAVEGCKVPEPGAESTSDWIDRIASTPSVPCTDIQWRDPVLRLTMANYNALLNLALFMMCALSLAIRQCPSGSGSRTQP
jgi:disulfide bond formation protein DsbB